MNEQKLARELRQRKPAAYERLIQEYGRLIWTVAAGILAGVGFREDVEEVVADVFVELWQRPEQFDPARGDMKRFLCVKAKSRAIDRMRQLCRTTALALEEQPEPAVEDVQTALLRCCTVQQIQDSLAAMPPPDGEILALRLLYELKPAEIAVKLSLPLPQVYERIRRGKARLAAILRQEGYYE